MYNTQPGLCPEQQIFSGLLWLNARIREAGQKGIKTNRLGIDGLQREIKLSFRRRRNPPEPKEYDP
jgi:hypothetical protein